MELDELNRSVIEEFRSNNGQVKNQFVIASFAGAEKNPPWFHNLVANPEFDLEVGGEKFRARATVLDEPERTLLFNKMVEKMPVFADYQEKTERVIPVLALERI